MKSWPPRRPPHPRGRTCVGLFVHPPLMPLTRPMEFDHWYPLATLAQLAPVGSRNPLASAPRLPEAPLLERWLYEAPWTPAVALVVLGVVAAVLLMRMQRPRVLFALVTLAASLALAGFLVLVAARVETTRELLARRTGDLVRAVLSADAATVDRELSPGFALTLLGRSSGRNRAYVVGAVRGDIAQRYGAKSSELRWVRASVDGPGAARTQVSVLAQSELLGAPTPTVWMLSWRTDGQGRWMVTRLEAQEIGLFTSVPDP